MTRRKKVSFKSCQDLATTHYLKAPDALEKGVAAMLT
jgi:hypothetical protein